METNDTLQVALPRQLFYDGAPSTWPDKSTVEDAVTIACDRTKEDLDGPPHRFLLSPGDSVEYYLSPDINGLGEVLEISHSQRRVCVALAGKSEEVWFETHELFPADREEELVPSSPELQAETATPEAEPEKSLEPEVQIPDSRIIEYEGLHYDWPDKKALHDRDTISVDRLSEHCGRTPHRFFIVRGDRVNTWFSDKKIEEGTVTGVSHAKQQVRVYFDGSSGNGIWFSLGQIYPAEVARPESKPKPEAVPLSQIIEQVNKKNGGADLEPVPAHKQAYELQPYTFEHHKGFIKKLSEQTLTIEELKEQFCHLLDAKDSLVSDLKTRFKAPKLKDIALRLGDWNAKSQSKQQNAESVWRKLLMDFHLADSFTYSFGEQSYEDSLKEAVLEQTDTSLAEYYERQNAKAESRDKALANPETKQEFAAFIRQRGFLELTVEQVKTFDELYAADSRKTRRAQRQTETVSQFESEELDGFEFKLIEGYHSKKQCPLHIVQLASRVERATFTELKGKAKMLGGWYSSFVKAQAGFQFLEKDKAERFISLLGGDVDRKDVLSERKTRQEQTTGERLHELATDLTERSEQTIESSENSLQNTARRADIQAGIRGRAYADLSLARTLHSVAQSLESGEATYLDSIRHKVQLEELDSVLYLAKWERLRHVAKESDETAYRVSLREEEEKGKAPSTEDIKYAKYPYPELYRRHLDEALALYKNRTGCKQAAAKLSKLLRGKNGDYVRFKEDYELATLEDFLSRVKAQGYQCDPIDSSIERFKRIRRADLYTPQELRCALREYLPHIAAVRGDDPVAVAERELIGKELPGFFPTPRETIEDELLEAAAIKPHEDVLEPSCGKGDIVQAINDNHPLANVTALEFNRTLEDVLSAKGIDARFEDFLKHLGSYDKIVMNPPYERGADIDHVKHAHSLLKPGGRVVAIMSEGPFFRSDKKATEFREWLDEHGGTSHKLPEDTFKNAFRSTSVRTRVVVIER